MTISQQLPLFLGLEGGRCTKIWLYFLSKAHPSLSYCLAGLLMKGLFKKSIEVDILFKQITDVLNT